jgi:dihydroorotate dehydrogenase electron transfer subunit
VTFIPAIAGNYKSKVRDSVRLSERYFLLSIRRPRGMPEPAAGQFVHVGVPDGGRFFLRRPFSVFDCDERSLDLLIVEVGAGTRALRELSIGDDVEFYGPLGSSFPSTPGRKVVAIGGGVGLAPLYFHAFRKLGGYDPSFRLVYGGRTREDLFLDHIPMESGGVMLATEDGSYGFHGNAVELAADTLARDPAQVIFSCGPTPMLHAAQRLAGELGLPHYVSLENRMGCGLGACRACVVPTRLDGESPYRTVCHDGPVFDAADLVWEKLPAP